MDNTKVHEGELIGEIPYEIHVSEGFSGKAEVALIVKGEVVAVTVVEIKRSGNIVCQPANARRILIKCEPKEEVRGDEAIPNLEDVLDEGSLGDEDQGNPSDS